MLTQQIRITREWAMPSHATFTIKPIKSLLDRYVGDGKGWADPFAGNNSPAQYTNDLNPETKAKDHMLAIDWVAHLNVPLRGALFDPPYSGRQVAEHYRYLKRVVHTNDTNGAFYSTVKKGLGRKIISDGYAICFGWNSNGFGKYLGFELVEILLIAHGAGHNDTICTVERKCQDIL